MITVIIRERGYNRRSWSHLARTQDQRTAIDRAVRKHFGARAKFERDRSPFHLRGEGTSVLHNGRVVRRVGLMAWEVLAYVNIRVDAE